jgi:uncharacterized protein
MPELHRIDGDPPILYDVEQTFTYTLPCEVDVDVEDRRPRLSPFPLPHITDVSIDLSGACNLRCLYCFENDIGSRLGAMTDATATATLDFVFHAARAAEEITLHFGSGEPLLRFDLLQRLVIEAEARAKASGQRIGFELTTNATLVNRRVTDFFAAHPFHVHVSCDGPAGIHDANRPLASGRGSYAAVKRGLDELLARRPRRGLTVNAVLAPGTRLLEVWNWAKSLRVPRLIVIKPVGLVEDDLELYARDLQSIAGDLCDALDRGERPVDYQPLTKVVRRLMLPQPVTRYCGAGGTYIGVGTDGSIFPCFRHIGVAAWRLGSVHDGIDNALRAHFRTTNAADVDRRPECRECWARYLCGGGCYADSTVYGADPLRPKTEQCPFWKAEIETAIRLFRRLVDENPEQVLKLVGNGLSTLAGSPRELRADS